MANEIRIVWDEAARDSLEEFSKVIRRHSTALERYLVMHDGPKHHKECSVAFRGCHPDCELQAYWEWREHRNNERLVLQNGPKLEMHVVDDESDANNRSSDDGST